METDDSYGRTVTTAKLVATRAVIARVPTGELPRLRDSWALHGRETTSARTAEVCRILVGLFEDEIAARA